MTTWPMSEDEPRLRQPLAVTSRLPYLTHAILYPPADLSPERRLHYAMRAFAAAEPHELLEIYYRVRHRVAREDADDIILAMERMVMERLNWVTRPLPVARQGRRGWL